MVSSGAFATKAINDKKIGAITADKLIEYLEGKPVNEIMAEVVAADDVLVNSDAAAAIGVSIPDNIGAQVITDSNS